MHLIIDYFYSDHSFFKTGNLAIPINFSIHSKTLLCSHLFNDFYESLYILILFLNEVAEYYFFKYCFLFFHLVMKTLQNLLYFFIQKSIFIALPFFPLIFIGITFYRNLFNFFIIFLVFLFPIEFTKISRILINYFIYLPLYYNYFHFILIYMILYFDFKLKIRFLKNHYCIYVQVQKQIFLYF